MTDPFGVSPAQDVPPPPAASIVPGFRLVQLIDRDEVGYRYLAEEAATGLARTVRIIAARLSNRQRRDLDELWADLAGRALHPLVARVVAHGMTQAGAPWVATDAGATTSLAAQLASGHLPEPVEVLEMAAEMSAALGGLHEEGLVHGGISPVAIVREEAMWRLTDVGLAGVVLPTPPASSPERAPATGLMAYAAPEVLLGEPPTPAADVYALGLTVVAALARDQLDWSRPGNEITDVLRRSGRALEDLVPAAVPQAALSALGDACHPEPERRPTAASLPLRLRPPTAQAPAERVSEAAPLVSDDDVQFTVYRPATVRPDRWYTMLAFAHKTDLSGSPGAPDPIEEVKRQAEVVLGEEVRGYVTAAEDASQVLSRGSELTFLPDIEGIEFNPPHASFRWEEPVHREDFRLRASRSLDGRRARGRLSVYFGALLLAEVNLTIRVDSGPSAEDAPPVPERERAQPYRKIFASYSHRDHAIVQQVAVWAAAVGDQFLRDCTHLRAGEVWSERLQEMIRDADVFQLFWSTNSITSPFVRQEWEYALSLGRRSFVRPCYWEEPLPARPEDDLPPMTLQQLHFQRLAFATATQHQVVASPQPAPAPAPPAASQPVRQAAAEAAPAPPPPAARSEPARADLPAQMTPPPVDAAPPPLTARSHPPRAETPPPRRRRRSTALVGVAGAALAAVGLLTGTTLLGSSGSPPGPRVLAARAAPPPALSPGVPGSNRTSAALSGESTDADAAAIIEAWLEPRDTEMRAMVDRCAVGETDECQTVLEFLLDECEHGHPLSCDVLYLVSPPGSDLERYGDTCGGRVSGVDDKWCRDLAE